MPRRNFRKSAANGVIFLECAVDDFAIFLHKIVEVNSRSKRSQETAGVVVAAMYARLIVVAGVTHKIVLFLEYENFIRWRFEMERQAAAKESPSDNDNVVSFHIPLLLNYDTFRLCCPSLCIPMSARLD